MITKENLTPCEVQPCKQHYSYTNRYLAWVVRKVDSTIHWINHYPADNVVCFDNTDPLDSDLSGGQRYPAFEQLGPVMLIKGALYLCLHISLV